MIRFSTVTCCKKETAKPRTNILKHAHDSCTRVRCARSAGLVLLMLGGSFAILVPVPPVAAAGQISEYITGLNWPIALAFAPDGRIFVAQRSTGSIYIIQNKVF